MNMKKTGYLFSEPSFLTGIARIIDYKGSLSLYNASISPDEADYNALKSDWTVIGEDLKRAIDEYEQRK